jgi:hypothetical protein
VVPIRSTRTRVECYEYLREDHPLTTTLRPCRARTAGSVSGGTISRIPCDISGIGGDLGSRGPGIWGPEVSGSWIWGLGVSMRQHIYRGSWCWVPSGVSGSSDPGIWGPGVLGSGGSEGLRVSDEATFLPGVLTSGLRDPGSGPISRVWDPGLDPFGTPFGALLGAIPTPGHPEIPRIRVQRRSKAPYHIYGIWPAPDGGTCQRPSRRASEWTPFRPICPIPTRK